MTLDSPSGSVERQALAAFVFTTELTNRREAQRLAYVKAFFVAIIGIFADLSDSFSPAIGDLLVVRRDNGEVVLRRDNADAGTVSLVRRELEQLTVADFLEKWQYQ